MFFGRQNELKRLDSIHDSRKFECVVLHGRLRVGKTALLREFLKGKRAVYFAAQETSDRENLNSLIRCVETFPQETGAALPALKDFYEEAFERLQLLARTERLILVIDDYEFLTAANRGISELICRYIDRKFIDSRLMLVICGSSEPVMESEALGYDCPFHGRRTAQIKLEPFTFFDAKRFYSSFSPFDIALVYGITGGVPGYLERMDPGLPLEENIKRSFFDTSSPLFEEPAGFLRREVRDPTYYNAVLKAIAAGCTKNSEISAAVGLETSACTAYLKNLTALGLVGKYTPVTEKAGKKTIYEIEDSLFRFWYRFVPDNLPHIQLGMVDKFWRNVARDIPAFMQKAFEDICRQWVLERNEIDRLPAKFIEVGRWWGVDPVWKRNATVPILAYSDDNNALFGDCVWSDEPAGVNSLISLEDRSRLFRYPKRHLYLFSRSGFSSECADAARRIGANLVMFE